MRAGLGVLGLVVLSACSSSDATKSTGGTPTRTAVPDQVRAELKPVLDAQCGWLFKCCSAGELAQQLGPAMSGDCSDHLFQSATVSYPYGLTSNAATESLLAVLNYVQYGFDHSAVKIDSAAIAACAAELSANDCTPAPPVDHCAPTAPVASDACVIDKLLVGTLPAGADCTAYGANECAPGLMCRSVSNDAGVCIPTPMVGDLCLRDEDCGSLICDWASGKCATGADYGAACAFSDPDHPVPGTEATRCKSGLVCDTINLKCADPHCAAGINCSADQQCPDGVKCVMNTCGPLKNAGETCYQTKDCAEGNCTYDPLANRSLCTAPKAVGASCQQPSDCASGWCEYDPTAMASACKATVKNGQPCTQADQCTSGKCGIDGTCAAVAVGDTCASDADCATLRDLFCVDKACAKAPFEDGTTCMSDMQCQSEACVAMTCTAKGAPKDPCGASTDAPCDDTSFCDVPAGKSAGTCAAKKAQGELCARDIECAGSCQAVRGELRCTGEPAGVALCGGT